MWENQSKSPLISGEFFNPPVWGPNQTHWVRPPEHQLNSATDLSKKVLICDVWGVTVSWKMVGKVVSRHFHLQGVDKLMMFPVGLPANRAFFFVKTEEET